MAPPTTAYRIVYPTPQQVPATLEDPKGKKYQIITLVPIVPAQPVKQGALGQAHMLDPDDHAVTSQPGSAARMREHATRIANQRGGTFVIDTAINAATDDVVAIEFNDLPNSGFYASNAWAIAEALVDAHDRGYDCGSSGLPLTT